MVLKQSFIHEMKFSTELGELTLCMENSTDEPNAHFLNPLNLPKSMDFLELSHKKFLKGMDDYLEKMFQESADNQSSEAISLFTTELLNSSTEAMEPESKYRRMLNDNAVYPLKYQNYNFSVAHKYALNNSVLTLHWSFEPKETPYDYADLNIFSESKLFYEYAKNSFVNFLKQKTELDEAKKFAEIRSSLYL